MPSMQIRYAGEPLWRITKSEWEWMGGPGNPTLRKIRRKNRTGFTYYQVLSAVAPSAARV